MLQLCLHSLFGTKGPCHIRHDWCGCWRIVRAYLHETPVGGPTRASRFVLPLFVLHTPRQSACQAGTLQRSGPPLTVPPVMKSFYNSGNDLPCWAFRTLLPMYLSLSQVVSKQPLSSALGKITLLKTSQWDISPSCLCHPCTILNC